MKKPKLNKQCWYKNSIHDHPLLTKTPKCCPIVSHRAYHLRVTAGFAIPTCRSRSGAQSLGRGDTDTGPFEWSESGSARWFDPRAFGGDRSCHCWWRTFWPRHRAASNRRSGVGGACNCLRSSGWFVASFALPFLFFCTCIHRIDCHTCLPTHSIEPQYPHGRWSRGCWRRLLWQQGVAVHCRGVDCRRAAACDSGRIASLHSGERSKLDWHVPSPACYKNHHYAKY